MGGGEVDGEPLGNAVERAYREYAMYVLRERALPHLVDGLKPVQRRLMVTMRDLGLTPTTQYRKSARTIGDLIGRYHPHGDAAAYEAMVLLAQPFSLTAPLVDGHGNWGSADNPKSFAAMRYTEARLAPYSKHLLDELHQDTVDWRPTFDGAQDEPRWLPSQTPNLLVNGSTGIAVGMATNVFPHNLREILDAAILLANKKPDLELVYSTIQGPDFPTKNTIRMRPRERERMLKEGLGALTCEASYHTSGDLLVFDTIPWQRQGSEIIVQIARLIDDKQLPHVIDVRDEADYEAPVRIVVQLKRGSSAQRCRETLATLFARTALATDMRMQLKFLGMDGSPTSDGVVGYLSRWVEQRRVTIRRRIGYDIAQLDDRIEILEGFLLAYDHLEEVIRIVREEDDAQAVLQSKFKLSERQAQAILDMRLRQLARIQQGKLESEHKDKTKARKELAAILASDTRLNNLLKRELKSVRDSYGRERVCPIVLDDTASSHSSAKGHNKPTVPLQVAITSHQWIYATSKRSETALENLELRTGDSIRTVTRGKSSSNLVMASRTGKLFVLPGARLDSNAKGEPIRSHFSPEEDDEIVASAFIAPESEMLLVSSSGHALRLSGSDCGQHRRAGSQFMRLGDDAELVAMILIDKTGRLVLNTQDGMLAIPFADIAEQKRGRGKRLYGKSGKAGFTQVSEACSSSAHGIRLSAGKKSRVLTNEWLDANFGIQKGGHYLPVPHLRGYKKSLQLSPAVPEPKS